MLDEPKIALSPKVFDLLLYLVSNAGRVVEKGELMSTIWRDTITARQGNRHPVVDSQR